MSYVKQDFMRELRALFVKWNASIEAKDHYQGYPECGEDIRMLIDIPPIYKDGTMVRDGVEIDLGGFFSPEPMEEK